MLPTPRFSERVCMTERDASTGERPAPVPAPLRDLLSVCILPPGWGDQPSDPAGEKAKASLDPGLPAALAPSPPPLDCGELETLHILVPNGLATGPQYDTGRVAQMIRLRALPRGAPADVFGRDYQCCLQQPA